MMAPRPNRYVMRDFGEAIRRGVNDIVRPTCTSN